MSDVSTSLHSYLATLKRPSYLLGPLERHLLANPRDQDRRTDVLHPSEITKDDWCIRASWYLLNGEPKPAENIPFRLLSIFEEGHAIHHKWQSWLEDMDVLIGTWTCKKHGPWFGKRSDTCLTCSVKYDEVLVLHSGYRVQGRADGWLEMGGDTESALLEVKSIGTGTIRANGGVIKSSGLSASFQQIKRPYTPHIRQTCFYRYCLQWMFDNGLLPMEPPKQILFLYECKEDQAPKEFMVEYHEGYIARTLERLDVLFPLDPEPPMCTGSDTGSCKACEVYE